MTEETARAIIEELQKLSYAAQKPLLSGDASEYHKGLALGRAEAYETAARMIFESLGE